MNEYTKNNNYANVKKTIETHDINIFRNLDDT